MVIFLPQQFANSCGLACVSYIVGKSEQEILDENPDILSANKLNFIGLYCPEIIEIFGRYERQYEYAEYSEKYFDRLDQVGTIVYIEQLNHYLVRLIDGWGDSYYTLRGIPNFGYREELPYVPRYVIYQPQYH